MSSLENVKQWAPHDIVLTNKGIQLTAYASLRSPEIYQIYTGCYDTSTNRPITLHVHRQTKKDRQAGDDCVRIHHEDLDNKDWRSDYCHDAEYSDTPLIEVPNLTCVPLRVLIANNHRDAFKSVILQQKFGLKVDYYKGSLNVFHLCRSTHGEFPEVLHPTNLTASFSNYEYGLLLYMLSDHPMLEALAFGFDFDGLPIVIALARMSTEAPERDSTIRLLMFLDPYEDSDWSLSHTERSADLSSRMWDRALDTMSKLGKKHVRKNDGTVVEVVSSGPSRDGLWMYRGSTTEESHFIFASESHSLEIIGKISPTHNPAAPYKVMLLLTE